MHEVKSNAARRISGAVTSSTGSIRLDAELARSARHDVHLTPYTARTARSSAMPPNVENTWLAPAR
jgi:hypothetical protein